jgi:hypothetical protein
MDIVNDIIWRSTLLFLWGGALLAVVVGLCLLVMPGWVQKVNSLLAHRFETESLTSALDRPRRLERYVYRHHRIAGYSLFAGSAFVIFKFLLQRNRLQFEAIAANDTFGLLDAGIAIIVIVAVLGAAIGLIMATKPSLLRDLEAASNQWVSIGKLAKIHKMQHLKIGNMMFVSRHLLGVFLITGGGYVALTLGNLLFSGHWQL